MTTPFLSNVFHTHGNPLTLNTALQLKLCNYKTVRGDTIVVPQPDIFLPPPILTLDLHHRTEAPQPRGCNILYRFISAAKNVFKGSSHPEPPHLQTTKSRHFQSQVSDAVAFVFMAPGHSCTWLTLQLSGGSSSKPSRDRHTSPALINTTHVHINPCANARTAKSRRAGLSHSGYSEGSG